MMVFGLKVLLYKIKKYFFHPLKFHHYVSQTYLHLARVVTRRLR